MIQSRKWSRLSKLIASKEGALSSLQVEITGDEPLIIQWFKDGKELPGKVGPATQLRIRNIG